MNVAALRVRGFAEQPFAHHVQHGLVSAEVRVILGEHVAAASFLDRAHELPALFDGCSRGNFRKHMFAGAHRIHGHIGVILIAGNDEDRIHVGPPQQVLVVLGPV